MEVRAACVSFKSQYGAAIALHVQQSNNPTQWVAEQAPEPRDVYWPFFSSTFIGRRISKLVVIFAYFESSVGEIVTRYLPRLVFNTNILPGECFSLSRLVFLAFGGRSQMRLIFIRLRSRGYQKKERPKFQLKEDEETSGNGSIGEASNTMKVIRDPRDEGTIGAKWDESVRCLF